MKALFVWDSEYPWDVRVEKICDTLISNGNAAHIICRNEARRAEEEVYQSVRIHRVGLPRWIPNWLNSIVTFPAFVNPIWLVRLVRLIRRHRIQLIIVRDLPMALAAVWAGRICQVPVALDMAECYPELLRAVWKFEPFRLVNVVVRNPRLADWVELCTLRMINHILVVVEESRDRLIRMGVDPRAITLVGNTPRHRRFKKGTASFPGSLKAHRGKFILMYVGYVNYSRGLDVVISALCKLIDHTEQIHLTLVGSGNAIGSLKNLVIRLHLEQYVSFEGWIDNRLVPEYITSSDVCIISHRKCSHWDNTIPNKLFDYMAAGKAVLASDVIPMRRIVTDTQCGLIYKDDDPDDCCAQLKRLMDPILRERLGKEGERAVVGKYNWDVDAERLMAGLESVLEQEA
ncbi:MAG: glycosyltransferase family 4 protein [Nitrospira sp.]|nr:glycosyltransferase family 4 protein [Nitrospira sp.]